MNTELVEMKNKYNIGQKVPNGIITRIEHSVRYCMEDMMRRKIDKSEFDKLYKNWYKIDADWYSKPIYCITFCEPVAIFSMEEFLEQYPYISKEPEMAKLAYETLVQKRYELMVPEACVIPIEEDKNAE